MHIPFSLSLSPLGPWRPHRRQPGTLLQRDFLVGNLLVRIHLIIKRVWWTGLAPWVFKFPFPGCLTSTFLDAPSLLCIVIFFQKNIFDWCPESVVDCCYESILDCRQDSIVDCSPDSIFNFVQKVSPIVVQRASSIVVTKSIFVKKVSSIVVQYHRFSRLLPYTIRNRMQYGMGIQHAVVSSTSEREFFIDNLLVRIHVIIEMIRWTGLAPWKFESPFSGSLTSTFLNSTTSACELGHRVVRARR